MGCFIRLSVFLSALFMVAGLPLESAADDTAADAISRCPGKKRELVITGGGIRGTYAGKYKGSSYNREPVEGGAAIAHRAFDLLWERFDEVQANGGKFASDIKRSHHELRVAVWKVAGADVIAQIEELTGEKFPRDAPQTFRRFRVLK